MEELAEDFPDLPFTSIWGRRRKECLVPCGSRCDRNCLVQNEQRSAGIHGMPASNFCTSAAVVAVPYLRIRLARWISTVR